jgi:hypothetical protein
MRTPLTSQEQALFDTKEVAVIQPLPWLAPNAREGGELDQALRLNRGSWFRIMPFDMSTSGIIVNFPKRQQKHNFLEVHRQTMGLHELSGMVVNPSFLLRSRGAVP